MSALVLDTNIVSYLMRADFGRAPNADPLAASYRPAEIGRVVAAPGAVYRHRGHRRRGGRSPSGGSEVNEAKIVADPKIMMGKPVIAGTRITVESVLEKLAAGESIEQVLDAHPRLTREGMLAALDFAAKALRTGNDAVSHNSATAGLKLIL